MAIGKPVALDARAELRETRGFISMTTISPGLAVRARTGRWRRRSTRPTARMTVMAASRSVLQLLVGERHHRGDRHRVAGVHPHRVDVLDRADDHRVVGDVAHHLELDLGPARAPSARPAPARWGSPSSARSRRSSSSSGVRAAPPPSPPRVKPGRRISGRPSSAAAAPAGGQVGDDAAARAPPGRPRPSCRGRPRGPRPAGSPSASAPISSTPWRSRTPVGASGPSPG